MAICKMIDHDVWMVHVYNEMMDAYLRNLDEFVGVDFLEGGCTDVHMTMTLLSVIICVCICIYTNGRIYIIYISIFRWYTLQQYDVSYHLDFDFSEIDINIVAQALYSQRRKESRKLLCVCVYIWVVKISYNYIYI